MKTKKNLAKKMMEKAAVNAAKAAAGTASINHFHQPKEPKNLRQLLSK